MSLWKIDGERLMPLLSEAVVLKSPYLLGAPNWSLDALVFSQMDYVSFCVFFLFLPHFLWYRSHKIDFTQEIFLACALIVERENICT